MKRAALGGLIALVAILFHGAVFGGRTLYQRDINMVWLPQVESLVSAVAGGSLPLWDPHRGFGQPLLADPRAEVFYPVTWLNLLLPPWLFYTLFVVAHLVVSGFGLFLLARRWQMPPLAAFTAATAWTASGPLLSLAAMWHHLAGAAWIPWLFLGTDVALAGSGAAGALPLALVLALQILAGSPDYTALSLLALAVYLLPHALRACRRSTERRALLRVAAGLLLGLLLSAMQWLPTLDLASRSERWSQPRAGATTWSLHPLATLELGIAARFSELPLNPAASDAILDKREPWLHSIYLGLPMLGLAFAGLLAGRTTRERRWLLAALGVASTLLAWGRFSPAYDIGIALLPPLAALRFPVKTMAIAAFCTALLAGFGVEAMQAEARARRACAVSTLALCCLSGLAAVLLGSGSLSGWLLSEHPVTTATVARLGATAALGAIAAGLALGSPSRAAALIPAIGVLDLLLVHVGLSPTAPREIFALRPDAVELVRRTPLPRIYAYDYSIQVGPARATRPGAESYAVARLPDGWPLAAGLVLGVQAYLNPPTAARWGLDGSFDPDILGFDPEPRVRMIEYLRSVEGTDAHLRLLRIGAVTHALALRKDVWWRDLVPLAEFPGLFADPVHVFMVPDPLPRVHAVDGVRVADGSLALDLLANPGFDPAREVILPDGRPEPAGPNPPGSVRLIERRADRLTLEARMTRPGVVLVTEAFDPGWRAFVDAHPTPVLRANVAFRGLRVGAGQHAIELVYRPPALAYGVVVALAGLATSVWILVRPRAAALD